MASDKIYRSSGNIGWHYMNSRNYFCSFFFVFCFFIILFVIFTHFPCASINVNFMLLRFYNSKTCNFDALHDHLQDTKHQILIDSRMKCPTYHLSNLSAPLFARALKSSLSRARSFMI